MKPSEQRRKWAERFFQPLNDANDPFRRVGWESEAAHLFRLRKLVSMLGPLQRLDSIVDVGCGEGRLWSVLKEGGFGGRYCGEDILASMIDRAQQQWPDQRFELTDSFAGDERFDAVLCCGTLNHRTGDDATASVIAAMERMWSRAGRVLVFDFAVQSTHHQGHQLALARLEDVWRRARELTPAVEVSEAGIPGEAQLALHRDRAGQLLLRLPGEQQLFERVEILLHAREPLAALEHLGDRDSNRARLLAALARLQQGKARRAERELRKLTEVSDVGERASITLGSLLMATLRFEECIETLNPWIEQGNNEARLIAALAFSRAGHKDASRRLVEAISDPWIAREARRLVQKSGS